MSIDERYSSNRIELDIQGKNCLRSVINIFNKKIFCKARDYLLLWSKNSKTLSIDRNSLLINSIKKYLHSNLKKNFNNLTGTFVYKIATILNKSLMKPKFCHWKFLKRASIVLPTEYLKANSFIEILKKRMLTLMRYSLKCIKHNNNMTKIRNKKLLRKYIELWEKHIYTTEDKYFEMFYHWRGLSKLEKIYKLKEFKQLFN